MVYFKRLICQPFVIIFTPIQKSWYYDTWFEHLLTTIPSILANNPSTTSINLIHPTNTLTNNAAINLHNNFTINCQFIWYGDWPQGKTSSSATCNNLQVTAKKKTCKGLQNLYWCNGHGSTIMDHGMRVDSFLMHQLSQVLTSWTQDRECSWSWISRKKERMNKRNPHPPPPSQPQTKQMSMGKYKCYIIKSQTLKS